MKQWLDLLRHCMMNGTPRIPSGVPTHAVFNAQITVPAAASTFPAVTAKQLHFGQVKAELAAFLHGATTLDEFHRWGCKIWDANAANSPHAAKEPGRVYGAQWRLWVAEDGILVDQLLNTVNLVNSRPHDRRHILQAYNPGSVDACLPACHMSAQFYVTGDKLNCTVTMRSCDLFLGLPFDVASYALLMNLMCRPDACAVLKPGNLTFNICDAHIYKNHQDAVRQVLGAELLKAPTLKLAEDASLWDFQPEHASLADYKHSGNVSAPMNIHEEF